MSRRATARCRESITSAIRAVRGPARAKARAPRRSRARPINGTFKPTFSGEVTVDGKGGGGGGKPKTYDWTAKAKYTIIEIHRKVAGQGNFVKISDVNNVDPVVISQKIELKVVGAPAGSQFQWSVTGGDPIKDYKFNANNATLTKLVAADMKNDQISFYYTSAANANISVTVTPSGEQPISKSAGFTINRPTVNIFRAVWTTATPPVGLIKDPPNIISVGLGGYDNSTPPKPTEGITWEAQITPPNGGDGGIAFIQTLTAKNMMKQYKSSVSWTILEKNIDTGNTPVLDTMVPYQKATLAVKANTLSAMLRQGDSPGTELVNLMTEVNLSGNFSLYLVYYAAGTSIPVPLGKIDWNYKARATKTGGSNNGYNGWERAPNGCSKGGGNSVNWSTPPTWNDNLRR